MNPQVNGYKAIEKYFNTDSNSKVSYVWYSVYKTSLYQKVWNTLKESNIFDVHLTEYLQTQLSLSFGSFVPVNTNHYIRLNNPKTRYVITGRKWLDFILPGILPDRWLDKLFAKFLGIDKEKI